MLIVRTTAGASAFLRGSTVDLGRRPISSRVQGAYAGTMGGRESAERHSENE